MSHTATRPNATASTATFAFPPPPAAAVLGAARAFAGRAANWARVVRGRRAAHAVAILTAACELALFELDGRNRAMISPERTPSGHGTPSSPWRPISRRSRLASHQLAHRAGQRTAGFSPPMEQRRGQSGPVRTKPHMWIPSQSRLSGYFRHQMAGHLWKQCRKHRVYGS